MSDKKPIAFLHPDEDRPGRVSLYVGPVFIEDHNGHSDDGWGVEEVERINAAVEAREARLRGAMLEMQHALRSLTFDCDGVFSTRAPTRETYNAAFDVLERAEQGEFFEYVPGDVACGLAFDLGVVQGTLHAVQNYYGPLLDVLNASGGVSSVMAVELARALGLFDHRERFVAGMSDDELFTELERRGDVGLVPRLDQ